MRRSVSAVAIARSESCSGPPRWPTPAAAHGVIASGASHRVTSPRWTSARSSAGQLPTWSFVFYFGWTLDGTSRSCAFGRHDSQGTDARSPRGGIRAPTPQGVLNASTSRDVPPRFSFDADLDGSCRQLKDAFPVMVGVFLINIQPHKTGTCAPCFS